MLTFPAVRLSKARGRCSPNLLNTPDEDRRWRLEYPCDDESINKISKPIKGPKRVHVSN
jgi:hypothetical protein